MVNRPQQLVLEMGEVGGAGEAAVIRFKKRLDPFPPLGERFPEQLDRRLAKGHGIAGMGRCQRGNAGLQLAPLDNRLADELGPGPRATLLAEEVERSDSFGPFNIGRRGRP